MQTPEVLEGIGVAVVIGATVADKNVSCDVGELWQQSWRSFDVLAEAADRLQSCRCWLKLSGGGSSTTSARFPREKRPVQGAGDVHRRPRRGTHRKTPASPAMP